MNGDRGVSEWTFTGTLEDGKRVRISGRVRWVTPFGGLKDARAGMGIELVGVVGDVKDAIGALLRKRAR